MRAHRGQQLASGATHGAADALQVDVPTHDEHGVRNRHNDRITRNLPRCPASVRHVDGVRLLRVHVTANRAGRDRIPGNIRPVAVCLFPSLPVGKILPLPNPANGRFRRRKHGRLVLAVAPGPAWTVLVMSFPARVADHANHCAASRTLRHTAGNPAIHQNARQRVPGDPAGRSFAAPDRAYCRGGAAA
jgi:hypothetical protein